MMSNDTESSSALDDDDVDATRTHRAYLRPVSPLLHFAANHRAVVATRRVVIDSSACCDVQKVQLAAAGASLYIATPVRRDDADDDVGRGRPRARPARRDSPAPETVPAARERWTRVV